jgi:hypothetical protein
MVLGLLFVNGCAVSQPTAAVFDVPVERYQAHVELLAHNDLKGRGTGSEGIDLAAGYIAGHFAAAGLEPGGPDGTYFQEFTLSRGGKMRDTTDLKILGGDIEIEVKEDFLPLGVTSQGEFSGDLAFVGYGITNPDKDHDDYANIDVTGKVVVMLRREPDGWSDSGRFSRHSQFTSKVRLAGEKGATGVIIVNKKRASSMDILMPFSPARRDAGLPAFHMKRQVIDDVMAAADMPSLAALQEELDKGDQTVSQIVAGFSASGLVEFERSETVARNVIGVLPGSGPNAHEYVMVGGHYDHLGERNGVIYNGADDNASGTAGVIEAAYAMAARPDRDRSVIFMTFTAEEIGLHGSRHYVNEPTVPIGDIVAILNMDMIGRVDHEDKANMLAIQGVGTGDGFEAMAERLAGAAGIPYIPDPSALAPSDHSLFYRAGVPSLFFNTGLHSDYHQPDDDTEKMNHEGGAQISTLVAHMALEIANAEARPVFAEVSERADLYRGRPGRPGRGGVVMGIVPDRDDSGDTPGWAIAMVRPDGAAQKAGMKAGDRITKIDDHEVNGMSDYRHAVSGKKAGDVVKVMVMREGKEVSLDVELQSR